MSLSKTYIYGRHALVEALRNIPSALEKVFVLPGLADQELLALIEKAGVPIKTLASNNQLRDVDHSAVRQGVFGLLSPSKLLKAYKEFIEGLSITSETSLVLLDEIQDPHNVGAIIRSAAAFGVSGILISEHNQAPITDTVIKVSSGMAFRVPIVLVGNINATLRDLKTRGFWIYGMDETATHPVSAESFSAPTLFIMGNEATGIRQKTRELCDVLLSISIDSQCESLNVAAATAVTLYAWSLQHPNVLK